MAAEAGEKRPQPEDGGPPAKRSALKYDFASSTKAYANGIVAPNRSTEFTGHLSGRTIRIPDVSSGYPRCKLAPFGDAAEGVEKWNDPTEGNVEKRKFGDACNHVRKFAVAIPSTNTVVEADFWRMICSNPELDGIGFHSMPVAMTILKLSTDKEMKAFLDQFQVELYRAIDVAITAEPEYMVMGCALEVLFGGLKGTIKCMDEVRDYCGLEMATCADAYKAALGKLKAKKLAIVTSYKPMGNKASVSFFEEIGCEVVAIHGMACGAATEPAHVTEAMVEPVFREFAALSGVDAIVQCGTNLSVVRLMDRLEKELGKPMIPCNAVLLWFALRENGINAPMYNCCRFCRDF